MDKDTIEIMKLAHSLVEANKIYSDLKQRGIVIGAYFNDSEGCPSIQLGYESEFSWGDRSRRTDTYDEISTDFFGIKIFQLVDCEDREEEDAKLVV